MGYVQEARENHVKKKVEEGKATHYMCNCLMTVTKFRNCLFWPPGISFYNLRHIKIKQALRSKMKQKALKECDRYTTKYAECASGRTISVVWQCRKQAKELNECLHQYTNDSVLEEMKKAYTLQQNEQGSLRV
ncbi:uncharacterized protein [Solanum lycopersicum]|uniref:uncharacterized protein isoform X1 n=1 Tax=Solanum lycopersicum TaxID=4081 RepID=UPI00374923F1